MFQILAETVSVSSGALTVIGTLVAGLVTAIAALWKHQVTNQTLIATKLDHCESAHASANVEIRTMVEKVGKLEGVMIGHEQAREDFKTAVADSVVDLSVEVLKKIKED